MSYETFSNSSPLDLAMIFIISLLITLAAYCVFPLLFASYRTTPITKKKYRRLCFAGNIIPLLIFIVLSGSSSGGPYFLWTMVFSSSGAKKLAARGLLIDGTEVKSEAPSQTEATKMSLSASGGSSSSSTKNHGNYHVSGNDIALQNSENETPTDKNNTSNSEAINTDNLVANDFIKSIAVDIVDNIAANRNVQAPDSVDPEYGLVPSKPIYTDFIEGQIEYLDMLRTTSGDRISWERKGSVAVKGINGAVDIYDTFLTSGELYKTLYLNMYSDTTSKIPPVGFTMRTVAETPPLEKNAPVSPHIAPAVAPPKTSKQRFCKYCGGAIDPETKKCTSCGKQFFRLPKTTSNKLIIAIVVLAILFGVSGLFISTYNKGINAMYNQQFIAAKQHFDNLLVGDSLFADEYAYIEAGVLMETGEYLESHKAFNNLSVPVPESIIKDLEKHIYRIGVTAYKKNDLNTAETYFSAVEGYNRSEDYLFLISFKDTNRYPSSTNMKKLINLIQFEDTAEIIATNNHALEKFLVGHWETKDYPHYYFEIKKEDGYRSQYNLPYEYFNGEYYEIHDGVYSLANMDGESKKYYKFSIISKDIISVYCYKDGNTYILYRK